MRAITKNDFIKKGIERPILFNEDMVNAERAGRKTQTRRTRGLKLINQRPDDFLFDGYGLRLGLLWVSFFDTVYNTRVFVKSPYGQEGDFLWVRETFSPSGNARGVFFKDEMDDSVKVSWKPSIHLKRIHARTLLEVTNIRVERLQSISEEDAIAEGAMFHDGRGVGHSGWRYNHRSHVWDLAIDAYAELFCEINGATAWQENPWVFVIEFKRKAQP